MNGANNGISWGAHGLGGSPRFEVIYVPVPQGGYCMRDNGTLRCLAIGGQRYNTMRNPHSSYYATREEASAIATWLVERAAGYPLNLGLCQYAP